MIVIVAGADKTGKTTMATSIAALMGLNYIKFSGGPVRDSIPETWVRDNLIFHEAIAKVLWNHMFPQPRIVFDRFFPDEVVYSAVLRGYSFERLVSMYKTVDETFARIGAKILHVVPHNVDVWAERFKDENYLSVDEALSVVTSFNEYLGRIKTPHLKLTHELPLEEVVGWLRNGPQG